MKLNKKKFHKAWAVYLIILFVAFLYKPQFALAITVEQFGSLYNAKCWSIESCKKAGGTPETLSECSSKELEDYIASKGITEKNAAGESKPFQLTGCSSSGVPSGNYRLSTKLPGGITTVFNPADLIRNLYIASISIGIILAVVKIVHSGIMISASAGSPETIKTAKDGIQGAIIGLLLLLGSYIILQTINPDLVYLRAPGLIKTRPAEQLKGEVAMLLQTINPPKTVCSLALMKQVLKNNGEVSCGTLLPVVSGTGVDSCMATRCPAGGICFIKMAANGNLETSVRITSTGDAAAGSENTRCINSILRVKRSGRYADFKNEDKMPDIKINPKVDCGGENISYAFTGADFVTGSMCAGFDANSTSCYGIIKSPANTVQIPYTFGNYPTVLCMGGTCGSSPYSNHPGILTITPLGIDKVQCAK